MSKFWLLKISKFSKKIFFVRIYSERGFQKYAFDPDRMISHFLRNYTNFSAQLWNHSKNLHRVGTLMAFPKIPLSRRLEHFEKTSFFSGFCIFRKIIKNRIWNLRAFLLNWLPFSYSWAIYWGKLEENRYGASRWKSAQSRVPKQNGKKLKILFRKSFPADRFVEKWFITKSYMAVILAQKFRKSIRWNWL